MTNSKVGTDTWAITATTKYINVGFRPKVIFFLANHETGDVGSNETGYELSFGVTDTSNQVVFFQRAVNDVQYLKNNFTSLYDATAVMALVHPTTLVKEGSASLLSVDDTGFTLNFTQPTGTAHRFAYMAWGGDSITNAHLGTFVIPNGLSGRQGMDVLGLGFKPTSVLTFSDMPDPPYPPFEATNGSMNWNMTADSYIPTTNGNPTKNGGSIAYRATQTGGLLINKNQQSTVFWNDSFVFSYNNDGFRYIYNNYWHSQPVASFDVYYLAIENGASSVTINSPTGNETKMPATTGSYEQNIFTLDSSSYVRKNPKSALFFTKDGKYKVSYGYYGYSIGFCDEEKNQVSFTGTIMLYYPSLLVNHHTYGTSGQIVGSSAYINIYDDSVAQPYPIVTGRDIQLTDWTTTSGDFNGYTLNQSVVSSTVEDTSGTLSCFALVDIAQGQQGQVV